MAGHDDHEMRPLQSMSATESPVHPTKLGSHSSTAAPEEESNDFTWPELGERWKIPRAGEYWNRYVRSHFTDEEKKDAWDDVTKVVKTYSDEMIDRWTREMDTLLVYAGLFSAVLTAFNVQSYAMLTPTGPDPVVDALERISQQLSSFSVNPSFVNSTVPPWEASANSTQSPPEQWAVWLNALWFSSLICSLSSASIAIMVKQWLNEYNTGISGNSRNTARMRQYRLDALNRWRVGTVISVLPMLLQISLGLFLAGLLVLLYNLNDQVAIAASVLVGALSLFALVTSVLPTVKSDCSYQTPLSLAMFYVSFPLRRVLYWLVYQVAGYFDANQVKRFGLNKSCERLIEKLDIIALGRPTLRATEKSWVEHNTRQLDVNTFAMSYTATMDLSYLDRATVCFTDLRYTDISSIFDRVDAENKQHGCQENALRGEHWALKIPPDMALDVLLARCRLSPPSRLNVSALGSYIYPVWKSDVAGLSVNRWIHFLSSCAIILHHYHSDMDLRFNENLLECMHAAIFYVNSREPIVGVETRVWYTVAVWAYKIFQMEEISRTDEFWFTEYTRALYILTACTRTIARQIEDKDREVLQALNCAIQAAQSGIIKYINSQTKSDTADTLIIMRLKGSQLEAVAGISDDMLNAMVDHVNYCKVTLSEDVLDSPWVLELEERRIESRKVSVSLM